MKLNQQWEIKLFKLFGLEPETCDEYDPNEQCCNNSDYCELHCVIGANGYKFLPISRMRLNLYRLWDWFYWSKVRNQHGYTFKWL